MVDQLGEPGFDLVVHFSQELVKSVRLYWTLLTLLSLLSLYILLFPSED